jgi:mannose-6-phosphate isomerase-like protein (cupin superfamily)
MENTTPPTTLLKRKENIVTKPFDKCHDGKGAIEWTNVLGGEDLKDRHLRFFHDDIIPPGVSIGVHAHKDEEYYYVLSGRGIMSLDSKTFEIKAGDIAAVFPGGSHGLENTGTEPMRIIVACAN